MKKVASKPWRLHLNLKYHPSISILIPTYNEEEIIRLKLENLLNLKYPKEKTQVIVVDSASTDNTAKEVLNFAKLNPEVNINVVEETCRGGKSRALNLALKHSTGEVIVVSDVDCFCHPDILNMALPYLSDPKVGAVAGKEELLNPNQSWVTKTESIFRNSMFQIQLGESKFYSTFQFEGGFAAYKRDVLDAFDSETGADDSGTALNIIQKGFWTIVVPEAIFFTFFPDTWKGKIVIKSRRAHHLLLVLFKSLRLLIKGKLRFSKTIVLSETLLFIINPFIFILLALTSSVLLFYYPVFVPLLILPFVIPKSRIYLIEVIQNNLIALMALISILMRKKAVIWQIAKESRKDIDLGILKKEGLI